MAKETLGPPRVKDPDDRPSPQLLRNQETRDKMVDMVRKQQKKLSDVVETQIADGRRLPYVGAIVLYRMDEGPSAGEQRPATVLHLLEHEGDTTRCVLKVQCNPDMDGAGVLDLPNVRHGEGLNEWLPSDPRTKMTEPDLKSRVPVGDA